MNEILSSLEHGTKLVFEYPDCHWSELCGEPPYFVRELELSHVRSCKNGNTTLVGMTSDGWRQFDVDLIQNLRIVH